VDAGPRLDERVLDRAERSCDADVEPGLLHDLAHRGLLDGLVGIGRAFRKGPGPVVTIATAAADDELRTPVRVADDDAAGGSGGGVPQACHGAAAALGRGADPERPWRAQCIVTSGRTR